MEETADRAEAEGRAETVLGAAAWERPFEPVTGAGAVGAEWVVEVVNALPDVPSRRPARVDGDDVTPTGPTRRTPRRSAPGAHPSSERPTLVSSQCPTMKRRPAGVRGRPRNPRLPP